MRLRGGILIVALPEVKKVCGGGGGGGDKEQNFNKQLRYVFISLSSND